MRAFLREAVLRLGFELGFELGIACGRETTAFSIFSGLAIQAIRAGRTK